MYCQSCGAQNADRSAFCSGCGKPLQAPAEPAPPTDREYFELAIGPNNTDYYLSKFEWFASGGSTVSWNWPAFFVTLPWLLYRKMWGYAAAYFFLPTILLLVFSLILGLVFSSAAALPVIGILAAIAIPAYQDYTIRAQVSEGLNMAAPVRAAVTETIQRVGSVPRDRVDAGLTPAATDSRGKYTDSIAVRDGRIDITFGAEANQAIRGQVLSLTPYATDDGIAWRCGVGPAPSPQPLAEYQPGSLAADLPKYVPSACRPGGSVPSVQ